VFSFKPMTGLSKSHIQRDTCDDGLPRIDFGQPLSLYGTPKAENLFLGDALEELVIALSVNVISWTDSHKGQLARFFLGLPIGALNARLTAYASKHNASSANG